MNFFFDIVFNISDSKMLNIIDKYGSKQKGNRTSVQAKIGVTYGKMRTDRVYRREGTNGVYIREGK